MAINAGAEKDRVEASSESSNADERDASTLKRILLIEDHPLFRGAFEGLLRAFAPNAAILSVGVLQDAFKHIESGDQIDCAFVDLELPDAQGFDGVRKLRAALPEMPLVVVSGLGNGVTRETCLAEGVFDVLPKTSNQEEYFRRLPLMLDALATVPRAEAQDRSSLLERRFRLSRRQAQIADYLIEGKRNGAIAQELGITENTVKVHITKLLNTLAVKSRAEATAVLLSDQVIERPSTTDNSPGESDTGC